MSELIRAEHREPFRWFAAEMVRTRDYDPNYFVIKGVCQARAYEPIDVYRYCVVFNGFYHFESADRFFRNPQLDPATLPYGVSRRGFRGNRKVLLYLSDLHNLRRYILQAAEKGGTDGWRGVYNIILANVRGAGPWAAYYVTDMMKVVLGYPITAPNVGDLGSSANKTGPAAGMHHLTGRPIEAIVGNERFHRAVYEEVADVVGGMEVFESILCNYMSLHKGRYYVGRDIDRQMPMLRGLGTEHWNARKAHFPTEFLGEVGGWTGIRKELMGKLRYY